MSPAARSRRHSHAYHVGFLLVAQIPMMAFAAALEPLRAANRLSGSTLYGGSFYSRDRRPVIASNGVEVAVHGAVGADAKLELLLVCAGTQETQPPSVTKWLRALARTGTALGGISLGAYALADAGLLDGRRCAVHWENLAAFTDRYPRVKTMPDILAIDGDRYTCSGGTSALDLVLQLITDRHGRTRGVLLAARRDRRSHPRVQLRSAARRQALRAAVQHDARRAQGSARQEPEARRRAQRRLGEGRQRDS